MKKTVVSLMLVIGQMSSGSLMAFDSFVVKNIKIEGIQRISKEAVLEDLPISVGDQVTSEKSTAAVHALFKTGFFKDVTLERDGNELIVKVVERPSIGKLEIKGLKSKEEINKILKDNNVAEGRIYDRNVMAKVEKDIIHSYLTKQRYGVKVDTKVTPEDRNRVKVELHIYEGDISTIKEIRFVGNKIFTDKQLKDQMFHKTKNWLSWFDKSDHYSKEKFSADLEMLRSFYMDRGYLNFQIESTQVSLSLDKKHVYLTINVSEGEQFFFKNIRIEGEIPVDKDLVQAAVDAKIKAGAVFSRKAIWESKDSIEEILGDHGYSKASVRMIDDVDQETRLVSLRFYIEPNKKITVRRITFVGNTLTEDTVLRRDVDQFEGSWISTKKIKESKEAMMRDGYASNVEVETVPVVDKNDQVDLIYKVEEQRTAQVSAGVSYSGADSLGFNLGADLRNVVGTGKDVNFLFNRSKAVQIYSLGYSDPYFTDSGIGMAVNFYNQRTRLSRTTDYLFDFALDTTGAGLGWQYKITQFAYFKYGLGFDHTTVKMDYNSAPIEARTFSDAYNRNLNFKEYFVNVGLGYNNLDTFLFPNKGITSSIDLKVSLPVSNVRMYRIDQNFSWFKPIYDPYIFNFKTDIGFADVYNNRPFPFYKNYYAGGGESIRGFAERSLGPRDSKGEPFGGNLLIEARAQVIFPPPFMKDAKSVRTALFLDAGQVYDTHSKSRNPDGIRYSVGVSLVWNTPLHVPITFSLARPLTKKHGDMRRAFAFSLGTQF